MKQLKYKDMFTLKKRPKIQLLCFPGEIYCTKSVLFTLLARVRIRPLGQRWSGSDPWEKCYFESYIPCPLSKNLLKKKLFFLNLFFIIERELMSLIIWHFCPFGNFLIRIWPNEKERPGSEGIKEYESGSATLFLTYLSLEDYSTEL